MYPQNQAKPAPTLASIQREFTYSLFGFRVNDQFTIVEDLPATKPIKQITKIANKTGKPYQVFVIRITSNNFEANLELFETELNKIAIACPKDITNFKGVTLAFDGQRWVYVSQDTNTPGQPQLDANVPLNANAINNKIVADIQSLNKVGVQVDIKVLTNICDAIQPGKALELIQAAKTGGYIVESNGIYRAP